MEQEQGTGQAEPQVGEDVTMSDHEGQDEPQQVQEKGKGKEQQQDQVPEHTEGSGGHGMDLDREAVGNPPQPEADVAMDDPNPAGASEDHISRPPVSPDVDIDMDPQLKRPTLDEGRKSTEVVMEGDGDGADDDEEEEEEAEENHQLNRTTVARQKKATNIVDGEDGDHRPALVKQKKKLTKFLDNIGEIDQEPQDVDMMPTPGQRKRARSPEASPVAEKQRNSQKQKRQKSLLNLTKDHKIPSRLSETIDIAKQWVRDLKLLIISNFKY